MNLRLKNIVLFYARKIQLLNILKQILKYLTMVKQRRQRSSSAQYFIKGLKLHFLIFSSHLIFPPYYEINCLKIFEANGLDFHT